MKLQLLPYRPLRVLLVSLILGLLTTLRIIFIEHGQVGGAILLGVLQTIVAFGMFMLILRKP